jgi:hypothetical protein
MTTRNTSTLGLLFALTLAGVPVTYAQISGEDRPDRAEKRAEIMEDRQANRQAQFCERFGATADKMLEKMEQHRNRYTERREERTQNREERADAADSRLSQIRSNQDAKRNESYQRLEGVADTDAKKAALKKFQETVEEAVETRRDAVDAAMNSFREGVQGSVSGGKETRTTVTERRRAIVLAGPIRRRCGLSFARASRPPGMACRPN